MTRSANSTRTKVRYKKGDKITICKNIHGHQFKIGETVIIDVVGHGYYIADRIKGSNPGGRWITDEEITPPKEDLFTKLYLTLKS